MLQSSFNDMKLLHNFKENHGVEYKFMDFNQKKCKCSKLLAVDDNEFNLYILTEIFKKNDYSIDIAHSGDEAIEKVNAIFKKNENSKIFCENCKFYKFVLMDIDMPIKNGYETSIILKDIFRKNNVNIPIIALSAFSQTEYQERAIVAGMEDYIEKPFNQIKYDYIVRKYLI